ncbi:hypothetical protein BE221DRAFT_188789 [Ostreococcus tauri]|uniref:Uncharacterized protein n=2 Tax=Ostreococcus tauri TaxID=70448 RepID=A0A1Y5IR86_OSTTA|nr:hypothetical protein BE221DRAFT_188789 [Ostreococcus tauri]
MVDGENAASAHVADRPSTMREARDSAEDLERRHRDAALARRHDGVLRELNETKTALRAEQTARETCARERDEARANAEEARRKERATREECERATRERDDARAAKRELLDASERKMRELDAVKTTMDGYIAALEAANAGKNKAEAESRKATAEASGALGRTKKLESEVKALEEHNAWLKKELEVKTSEILSSTKSTSAEALRLKQELELGRNKITTQERELATLKERFDSADAKILALEEELRDVRVEKARDEANFEKELAKSERIAEVSKEIVTEREGRIKELEATLRSAEAVIEAKKVEFDVALAEAKHAKARAEAELEAAKQHMSETTVVREPSHRSQTAEQLMLLSPAAASAALERDGMSTTELYSKYVEAEDALRTEREQKRVLEENLDAILKDLESQAPYLAERDAEYERALKSHEVLRAQLQDSESARMSIESELNAINSDRRQHERMLTGYRAQSADLARQVALLLNEVHELKGCPPVPMPVAQVEGGDAQAVITSRLVDFTDIQSLQAKNQEMLFVIRDLSDAQESRTSEAREEYERKLQELKDQTARQLEELSSKRTQQENIVQAIVRQRDMYKTLYTSAMGGGNGDDGELHELESKNSELVAIGAGSGVAMMETNNELVALNKELSHDLDKLKRESADRVKELQRQVDEHREAAATARGEANAANSSADFERKRYERLNEQYGASQRELHALSEKNSALTQQNAANEAKLRQQGASLDAAQERASNAQTIVTKLESENALLMIEQQRLSDVVSAAEEIKLKIESSRDSALALSSLREEEHKQSLARLTDEVNRLQQDYIRVRSELDIERERGRQQLAAHAAASSEFAQRSKSVDESSAQLKEQMGEAMKRADIAEAKLEMIEATLMKTEEKLRLATRTSGLSEPTTLNASSTGPITAQREHELLQAALKAGEVADEAKAALESEKTHTAQFKALAQQSDAALKEMTKAFDAHKAQSAKELSALKSECAQLKKEAADAASSVESKLALAVKDLESKAAQYAKVESEMKSVRAELERAQGETKAAQDRATQAVKDVESEHAKWREATEQYEKELAAHTADQAKLVAMEKSQAEVEKSLAAAKDSASKAERELSAARIKELAEKKQLDDAKRAAEAKISELTEQNTLLHKMIEKSKIEATDEQSSDEGEVLRYLRQERDAALLQVSTLTVERNKWQRDAEVALQEAESAKARVKASEANAMGEEKHKSLMQKVDQLNAIEQANAALRAEIEVAKADIAVAKQRESELISKSEIIVKELAQAKAAVAGHDTELETVRKEASRWEQRASQLVTKYGDVDVEEQGRVKTQLEEELAKAKEELANETIRADKAKSQLTISMKHIRVYNPEKVPLPEWQKSQKEQMDRLAELEAAAEAAKSEKKGESDIASQLASAKAELEAANTKVKSATETAANAEKALREMKAEVEKLQEAAKRMGEEAATETPAKTKPEEEAKEETIDGGDGDTAAAAPVTPSSDRFKIMAQKMQAEAMEAAKKLRETEEMLAAKDAELSTALKEKSEAVEKCATLQKELDGAREKLKLAEQLRAALEKKLSAAPAPSKPPLAELASKAKDFIPSARPSAAPAAPVAPVPFAPKVVTADDKEVDAKAAAKVEEKKRLEQKMEEMRQELERKKAAAAAAGTKRKADDVDDAAEGDTSAKAQKIDADAGPNDKAVEDDAKAAAEEDAEDEVEDDEADDDDAEEGELEGELEEDVDEFVDQLLVDDPAPAKPQAKRDTPGRAARGRPANNRQRKRTAGRGSGRGRGRGKKNA